MSVPKNTKHLFPDKLSAEQMQKYLANELTDAEQHQMEKYLLENEPETEALEGLGKIKNPKVLENDLNEIQKRIRARVKADDKIPVMPLGRWKYNPMNIAVAACVAVMLSSVTFLIVLNNYRQKENQPVAVTPKTEQSPEIKTIEPVIKENSEWTSDKIEDKTKPAPKIQPADRDKATTKDMPLAFNDSKEEEKPVENNAVEQPVNKAAEEVAVNNQSVEKGDLKNADVEKVQKPVVTSKDDEAILYYSNTELAKEKTDNSRKKVLSPAAKTETAGKKMINVTDKNVALQTLKGKVTDEDGNPLPGVNVSVKGSREGVVTDVEGNYVIEVTENTKLTYSFIGYTSTEVQVRNPEQALAVTLKPDVQALNEVVVIAYGSDDKKDEMEKFFTTEPTLGYTKYKQYIKTNLQYPQAAVEHKIEGNVIVSFMVNENRQLSDFKVRKSIGYGCDEEAIRLIKNGPGWNPALKEGKPVSQKVRLKIRFKLK
jgi:TonB family protein